MQALQRAYVTSLDAVIIDFMVRHGLISPDQVSVHRLPS